MATAYARPPATMTARMVVMMTPVEKGELERRAKIFGMSTSELMRRGGMDYDPANDETVLDAILTLMEDNTAAMRKSINDTISRIDERAAEVTAARAAHEEEMKAMRAELMAAA